MKQILGFWLPDSDTHFKDQIRNSGLDKGTYQYDRLQSALPLCKNKRVAVDVGGHIGLFSYHLSKQFEQVYCYEPNKLMYECLEKNLSDCKNVEIRQFGLGDKELDVELIHNKENTGMTHIAQHSFGGEIKIRRLDSWGFSSLDFLKIDCEGYEKFVIEGGEKTIREFMPTLIVEQAHATRYGLKDTEAVDLLMTMGYTIHKKINNDYIMKPQHVN